MSSASAPVTNISRSATSSPAEVSSPSPRAAEIDSAIQIRQQHATLWAGKLKPGEAVSTPAAPFVHLYVALGDIDLEGAGRLDRGDAARMAFHEGLRLTAGPGGAEVLVWEMHATLAA